MRSLRGFHTPSPALPRCGLRPAGAGDLSAVNTPYANRLRIATSAAAYNASKAKMSALPSRA